MGRSCAARGFPIPLGSMGPSSSEPRLESRGSAATLERPRYPAQQVLSAHADEFFVRAGVEDLELLGVKPRLGPERKLAEIALLQRDQQLLVFRPEPLQDSRIDHNPELEVGLVPGPLLKDLAEFALDFDAHGQ